jgi:RHS repeat-associated protein
MAKVEFDVWQQKNFDQNDCDSTSLHYNTPQVIDLDVLGRPFQTKDDNGTDGTSIYYITHNQLDIIGRPLVVTDAKGRAMTTNLFALSEKNQLTVSNIDSGTRWILNDVADNPRYTWDSRNHQTKTEYDALLRPTHTLLQADTNPEICTQIIIYGTDSNANNIGQIVEIDAQDGKTTLEYDFKGNVTKQTKQFAEEYNNTIDWNTTIVLQNETFTQETTYNALNVPTVLTQPDATILYYIYDKGGLLASIQRNETEIHISNIEYNEKQQRLNIYYGNNTKTKYEYNPLNFRLIRILTTRNTGQDILQDLNYTYDAVGNITQQTDNAQQIHYFNNQVIAPAGTYQYDALYRLINATGRELSNLTAPSNNDFPDDIPCPNTAENAMQNYNHAYEYDELGNMLCDAWKTNEYAIGNNYLLGHNDLTNQYTYDVHGNMLTMPHLSSMEWDYKDQLHSASNNTFISYYNYDAQGNRTRKVVEKGNVIETRYYVNGYELYRKENNGIIDIERTTLNIVDDEKVFVRIETKTGDNQVIRYQYDNHLGSACLELDDIGQVISYEEYHPFGTTSYRSGKMETEVSLKRYKYCGKERDEETGLYYYGMRYYAAWLCRFVSVDPLQFKYPHYTPYQYAGNKPISFIDLDGEEEKNTNKQYYTREGENNITWEYSINEKGEIEGEGGTGILNEVKISTEKTKERKEFEEYPIHGESSGWSMYNQSHGYLYQVGYAQNLLEVLRYSTLNYDVVYLTGQILEKIKNDPAMIQLENDIIAKIKSNENGIYGEGIFKITDKQVVTFGGERWTSQNENWFELSKNNPLAHLSTWAVGGNELTWTIRHATVKYWASTDETGEINIEYRLYDIFDLRANDNKDSDYNKIVKVLGVLYHDIWGGNENLQIRSEWNTKK